jgi:DNA-binding GntR family transcriptional regulator
MDTSAPPAPPASAATRAYDHLKRAVLDGTHPGGTLLTEGEVAEQLGVSRTPVREALLRLEAEGLVRLYPKKGALVVPVSAQEAHDVVEARALIEEWAAGRAWARRDEIVPQLEPLLEEMRRARVAEAFLDFTTADRSFHECVVAAAGNDVLTRSYRGLRERQLCISTAVMRMSRARMDAAVRDHQHLLEALRGGSRAQFLTLTRAHLDVAREVAGVVR